MGTDNVLILRDLDIIYPSLYDLFNQNFTIMGDKRFARIAFEFSKISSEVHKYFHAIVIVTKTQIQNLKLDPPFLNRFEKHIVNFKMLLDEIDIEIAKRITEFIDIISSFGHEKKLKINLEKSLINCKEHNIEGLIFKIKNDLKQNKIDENDVNDNYENTIIRKVFDKIVPTFCQDIIASTITCKLETKYKSMYDMVIEIYKKTKYNNFKSFFQNIQTEKSIVYTYTKITENLFDEETEITNKFGTFNIKNSKIEIIESIKSENDLIFILKEFKEQNQNILILKFAENDTNKVNSVNFIIENYIKDNQELKDKLIMFIIHRQRQGIKEKDESLKKKVMPDFISFINDDYYQIFIDNLQGNENNNILKFLEKKNEENLAKEYIDNSNFIENKIFTVLNYMKYNILYETSELNLKNYTTRVAEKIMKSEIIKSYIQKNIKSQSKTIKGIIKDTFISDIDENDIDFFEVINSKLSTYFVSYLLNIIFFSFKENVLNQMLINPNLEFLLQNEFINNIIINNFNKIKFNFVPKLKLGISQNKIDIYNGLIIPKSKNNFDIIIKYINDGIAKRYIDNEESLRKNYKNEDNIEKAVKTYYTELEKFENNVKIEINKNELFNIIYNQNYIEIKKCLLEDYFKYFIIIYLEKNKNNFQINEKLLHFLKLIIKIKLSDNHNQNYDFDYTMNEFIKIIVFTQSYKEDIKNLFTTFISIIKYSENIDEYILNILNEGIIKYEISERNKNYTQIVNNTFYIIIESMIRGALLSSAKLLKNDKVKFYEFFYSLTSIEANLQKINKKFYLFSKEIFNIRTIIKIEEGYKSNHEEFEQNYDNFIKNLLQQSIDLYDCNYNNFYNIILELNKIINETLTEKNDRYGDLLFFLFMQEFKNISDPDIRIKLIEEFFKNNILIRKSKIFLSETLKDLKPEIFNENKKKKDSKDTLIDNFLNLKNEKLKKFQSLIKIYNNIKSEEFNEILLYLFESQCQLYFSQILNKYKNEYNEKCCNEIINGLSLEYLKKAITTLYQNDNENNITKLYAIAYLKTYCYYYVEINYKYFDKADFTQLNILLMDKDDNNEHKNRIRNMRNIYIWRLYCKKFENFDQFISSDLSAKNIPIYKELDSKLKKEKDIPYIFANCFISPKKFDNYRKLDINDLNNDIIKEDFDSFYCFLVNKFISHLYGKNKGSTIQKLKEIYNNTSDIFDFEEEGKKLYQILLENEIFEKEIIKKINDNPLDQDDFEIILYSFRFIFNIHINNKKCFYNQLIKKNAKKFINDNYMPGNMAMVNEFLKSYYILVEKLKKRENLGYYTCKDCGFLYNVEPCTFPMAKGKCPNGHDIGGEEHVSVKKDIRIFLNKEEDEKFTNRWKNSKNQGEEPWVNYFVHTTLEEFKREYVDKNTLKMKKGIITDYECENFIKDIPVRDLNIISFRLLNFILYSFLLGSYALNNFSKDDMKKYLIENLQPHNIIGILKKNWELLGKLLEKYNIENVQTFINMIFDDIIEIMNNLESLKIEDELNNFEKKLNDYIMEILTNNDKIEKYNTEYKNINKELLGSNPHSTKEIILGNFDPSIYNQKLYPDIQYYTLSSIQNIDTFINKFRSSKENESKYALTNILLDKDLELTIDSINMKSLTNINKLANILLNIYSFKISREDGKSKKLDDELGSIMDIYNENNSIKIKDENNFKNEYIIPFIKSWDLIKRKSVQYKCRVLRDLEKGQNPLDMKLDNALCYYLVDDGDNDGGMFLASAYEHLIIWQNKFIDYIIGNNNINGILSSYVSQLEQEIDIQDATENDIININDNTFKIFYDLISSYSMRNIFDKNKIIYKNYNDIIYNFDIIEEELGKIILPGIKKFKKDKIRFIPYLFEGFRGQNSEALIDYNTKYIQRELSEEEKKSINNLIKSKNSNEFYKDVFSSLQILMNEIIKENYKPDHFIYQIIEKLPGYITLNSQLVELLKNKYEFNKEDKLFTLDSLVTIFEYFESLVWKEMRKRILVDYQLELNEETKKYIINYFEKITPDKVITKKIFTDALRRLMSRSIVGTREDIDIKPEQKLKLYITKEELWNRKIMENPLFDGELYEICKDEIQIGNCIKLYDLLDGDSFLNKEIYQEQNNEEKEKNPEKKENPEEKNDNEEEDDDDENEGRDEY